jgi:amino acid permease
MFSSARRVLASVVLALFTVTAFAQTPPVMQTQLRWAGPTQYTDGTPILSGDLTSFTILCGTSAANLAQSVSVPGEATTYSRQQFIDNFAMSFGVVYFCALTATTSNGLTSARSATVSFSLQDTRVPGVPTLTVE